jgi:hypothetical protein
MPAPPRLGATGPLNAAIRSRVRDVRSVGQQLRTGITGTLFDGFEVRRCDEKTLGFAAPANA